MVTIEIRSNTATLKCIDKKNNCIRKQYEVKEEKTKNATSLAALIVALEHMVLKSYLIIRMDNRYVYGAMLNNWPLEWMRREWKTAKGNLVANKEKWIYIGELLNRFDYEVKEMQQDENEKTDKVEE